jgi:glycosyltransferase involved in cell wall biosynthesis
MVIVHVLSSFGQGGQERVAVDLARIQRAAGHDVLAISIGQDPSGPIADAFRAAGVPPETVAKRLRIDPTLPVRLAARLRRHRADVVHTHNPHALIYGAPAGRLAGAVVIHSKHGMNPDRARRLWLRRSAASLVDAYVAVTQTLAARALEQHECDPAGLHVVPNGIDVARFAPNPAARREVRAELGIGGDAWVVGTVGRLAPEKAQLRLVDAMGPLLSDQRRLVIVGDGPERDVLRARIAEIPGGRHISMLGARQDVERVLAALDAFALTSRTEGLPLCLLEAMATGLPVLSTPVGGIPDLIRPGLTGLLSEAGPPFTEQLAALSEDEALGRRLGNAARQDIVAGHSVERMAGEYEALYRRALRARGAPGVPPRPRVGDTPPRPRSP